MSTERKVTAEDYELIAKVIDRKLKQLRRRNSKLWFQYIDTHSTIRFLSTQTEAYIVEDAYLVAYIVLNPWYAKADIKMLEEIIVLRLRPGGHFSAVPAFLERKALEAGAKLVCTGTALARADAALASFYETHGYRAETTLLVKEVPHG